MFGCCGILWLFWDRFKKPKKKIFISADCWLSVFELLPPSQLGLGIAMISHRFDCYADEHFKTRKWALKSMQIGSKIGKNGTKEMKIVNSKWKPSPIPENPLPKKVVGFEAITIRYIDQNAIAFLGHFRPLFDSFCPIKLSIQTNNDRILKFILHNIWPMFGKNIHRLELFVGFFHRLRKFVPSILNDCPSLHILTIHVINFFIEFPADDSATASDGQSVVKWLFTPLQNDAPKVLKCAWDLDAVNLPSKIAAFKAAFASASSPVNFIVIVWFRPLPFADPVVPFVLTNQLTREQLALKRIDDNCTRFVLIRCPIVRDADKWAKWEEEAIGYHQWNQIGIEMNDEDNIGDGLLDAIRGPSDH